MQGYGGLSMQALSHICLLGAFSLTFGDTPVTALNTPRLQSLLAYLLLRREVPQSRQHIAFLLWPDTTEVQAQTNLRQLIHRLRTGVPQLDPYLLVGSRTLQWNSTAPFTLDVLEFERLLASVAAAKGQGDNKQQLQWLSAAVDIYTGDLLPSLYYEWIIPERERLRQKYIDALEALVTLLVQESRYGEARLYAERLKSAEPLRESAYRTLMEICSVASDYSGGVRYYQECVAILEQELGVQPGSSTQATYRRILQLAARNDERAPALVGDTQAPVTPTNLPTPPNTFVGREAEVAVVRALLGREGVRLLTLVGPPGVGKTRLAIQASRTLLTHFRDGVYLVPLASLLDPALIVSMVAGVLGVREEPGRSLESSLAEWIADKHLLLTLDNFEQVLDGASILSTLLPHCPNLKVLATSREALRLYGEHEFPVLPLELPTPEEAAIIDTVRLGQYAAVKLFEERAAAAQYGFALDAENTPHVVAICRKLDALPLAIELAASRARLMPPRQLLRKLEQSLEALASVKRDTLARHQTLRAAIEWSYNLLTPDEQLSFRTLGIFRGGCTPEAANAVAGDLSADGEQYAKDESSASLHRRRGGREFRFAPSETQYAVLESLVDKSLVYVEATPAGERRFVMLETLADFAREKLAEQGETAPARISHAAFYVKWVEQSAPHLEQVTIEALEKINVEDGNLRATIAWAMESGNAEILGRMLFVLMRYWFTQGAVSYGLGVMEAVLSQVDRLPAYIRARLLPIAAAFISTSGDAERAGLLVREGVVACRELGDPALLSDALRYMAFGDLFVGNFDEAEVAAKEALPLFENLNHALGVAAVSLILGIVEIHRGEKRRGQTLIERSFTLFEERNDLQAMNFNFSLYGHAVLEHGDYGHATTVLRKGAHLSHNIGDQRNLADCLIGLAEIAEHEGDLVRAARLFGAAHSLFTQTGTAMWPIRRPIYERTIADGCAQLGQSAWDEAWNAGLAIPPDEVIALALGTEHEQGEPLSQP